MPRYAKFASVLIATMLGTGCAGTTPRLIETSLLCQHWTVQQVRKGDKLSDESAEEALERNEARVIWGCKRLENEASS